MKVLLISDFYPPFIGGAERAIADLGAELSDQGYEVSVATLWHDEMERQERDSSGTTIYRLEGTMQHLPFLYTRRTQRFHPPVPDPLLTHQLRRIIKTMRPSIVHGQSWMMLSALPLQREFSFATVAVLPDYSLLCPKKTLLYREERPCPFGFSHHCLRCAPLTYGVPKALLTTAGLGVGRRFYKRIDAFVAISSYVADIHRGDMTIPGSGERLAVIPNFVRREVLEKTDLQPLESLPTDYILYVGALGRHKGISVLLDAYRQLHTSIPLVLIGVPYPNLPINLPPNVLVYPGLSHDNVLCAMEHCRFFVSPSLWPEPFGIVVIEAMARRKAVIASNCGGLVDIVRHQETGLLVSPGDAPELANAIQMLIDAPELAARLGQAGRTRCEAHYTAGAVIPRFETTYAVAQAHHQEWRERGM